MCVPVLEQASQTQKAGIDEHWKLEFVEELGESHNRLALLTDVVREKTFVQIDPYSIQVRVVQNIVVLIYVQIDVAYFVHFAKIVLGAKIHSVMIFFFFSLKLMTHKHYI